MPTRFTILVADTKGPEKGRWRVVTVKLSRADAEAVVATGAKRSGSAYEIVES